MPSETVPLRDTIWQRLLGPEHIEIAFRAAARTDPRARLVINDYDFENTGPRFAERRAIALRLIRRLQDKGIPVHGIGLQSHLYAERDLDIGGLQRFMRDLDALGVGVEITELDVVDWRLPADTGTRDRAAASLVATYLAALTEAKRLDAIVTWGLTDRYSWIGETFPRKDKAAARPLPLDEDYLPKPMLTVLDRYRRGAD